MERNIGKQTNKKKGSGGLFKKITDNKRTFHAKMGTIKDRNGKNLTEADEIKKRWQEYTEELYKNGLNNLFNAAVLHSMCQQIRKTKQWPQDCKRSVFIPVTRRQCQRMFKLPDNCTHFTS